MKIKYDGQEKEIDLQEIYDILVETNLLNKEIIFFTSMLPIIKEIEIYFFYDYEYVLLKFENEKELKIYSDTLANKLSDIVLEDKY